MRDVTEEQRELIARGLKGVGPCTVVVLYPSGNSEAYRHADQLASAIREAGWDVRGRNLKIGRFLQPACPFTSLTTPILEQVR
jgi:hypothetical protein